MSKRPCSKEGMMYDRQPRLSETGNGGGTVSVHSHHWHPTEEGGRVKEEEVLNSYIFRHFKFWM